MNDLCYHGSIIPFNARAYYVSSPAAAPRCSICKSTLSEEAFQMSIPYHKRAGIWKEGLRAKACSESHANQWMEDVVAEKLATERTAETEGIPTQYSEGMWLYAFPENEEYIEDTPYSGKWLVFLSAHSIDVYWEVIAQTTNKGLLGTYAKTLTAYDTRAQQGEKAYVVCVYTSDYRNGGDVMKVRDKLYRIGLHRPMNYKSNEDTHKLLYGYSYTPKYRV